MTCTTPPWFPFYIGDYDHDTTHLSCEQHGAYFLLMLAYYRRGRALPDDNTFLAGIVKLTHKKWRAARPALAAFFQIGDGWWRHKRIDAEIAEQQARSDEHSRAGRKGATKRWGNPTKSMPDGMARPSNANDTTCPVQNGQGNGQVNPTKSTAEEIAQPLPTSQVQKGRGIRHAKSAKSKAAPMAQPCVSHSADFVVETPCHVLFGRGIEGSTSIKSMAPRWHTSQESSLVPYRTRENSLAHVRARDDAASAVAMGDGVAASRSPTPEPAAEAADPTFKADGAAMFDECLAIIRGKRLVLDSDSGLPVPPVPRILEFQAMLSRYNTLAGEKLTGELRLQAWDAIGRADAIGDPDALPPDLAAELAAIASLDAGP